MPKPLTDNKERKKSPIAFFPDPEQRQIAEAVASSLHEKEAASVELARVRNIRSVRCMDGNAATECRVIPAKPDGDCGLTAIKRCLELQGQNELAGKITRAEIIKLVKEKKDGAEFEELIQQLFENDKIHASESSKAKPSNMDTWPSLFEKQGCVWLAEHHLTFLSKALNLDFYIYCQDSDHATKFVPELSYEKISTTKSLLRVFI